MKFESEKIHQILQQMQESKMNLYEKAYVLRQTGMSVRQISEAIPVPSHIVENTVHDLILRNFLEAALVIKKYKNIDEIQDSFATIVRTNLYFRCLEILSQEKSDYGVRSKKISRLLLANKGTIFSRLHELEAMDYVVSGKEWTSYLTFSLTPQGRQFYDSAMNLYKKLAHDGGAQLLKI